MAEQSEPNGANDRNRDLDKPWLLKAIEPILADPADIKAETQKLLDRYRARHGAKNRTEEIQEMVTKKIISNYSYFAAFAGGATALTGVVPGLGTIVAAFGGAAADTALTMKYQIEMVMALAVVYGHDIEKEEEQRLCLIIAGLGAIGESAKQSGKAVGSKAFVSMARQYLKGSLLVAVKQVFKKVGVTFTRKGLEKAMPFGVGVVIGAGANKVLTRYVGAKACDFFEAS